MTEYERNWKEPESYTDYNNGCAMTIVNVVAILFVAALVGVLIWLVRRKITHSKNKFSNQKNEFNY